MAAAAAEFTICIGYPNPVCFLDWNPYLLSLVFLIQNVLKFCCGQHLHGLQLIAYVLK